MLSLTKLLNSPRKVSDFFLFGVLALTWIDILNIKRGNGISSIFALGGAGTLAFTLACQDLAKKALNGLAISTSEVFSVGDHILLGDGESHQMTIQYNMETLVFIYLCRVFCLVTVLFTLPLIVIGTSGTVMSIGWLSTAIRGKICCYSLIVCCLVQ